MPGIFEHDPCRFLESLHVTLPCRTVDHTRLTETAASDTATLDLQCDTVLCRLDMWNDRCFRHICMLWTEGFNRTVFFVGNFIERRHIDSRNLCSFQKEVLPAAAGFLICLICVKQSAIDSLSLSNIKEVKKLCQWLWIISTCTATDHERIIFDTFCCPERNSTEIQKLKYIGITHLISESDPKEIKLLYRILGLQSKERDLLLTHDLVQIRPRRKKTLTPYVVSFIKHII